MKGKSLCSFCLVTSLQRWCFQQRARGHERPSVHLPRPPRTPSVSCILAGGPLPLPPPSLVPPAPQGLGRHPLLGGGVWWGSLELGLSLCTPTQLRGFLRVWGPFGSHGGVGVLCRTGLGSRDASPLGTYLFLTPPIPQTRRLIREGGALPGSRRQTGPAEPLQRPEQASRPPEPPRRQLPGRGSLAVPSAPLCDNEGE